MGAPTVDTSIDARAARLIADSLGNGLTHPGVDGKPIALPLSAFRTMGLPAELTEHITAIGKLLGEAIIYLLTTSGIKLIDEQELVTLQERDQPPPPTIILECPQGHPLLEVVVRPHVALSRITLAALRDTVTQCDH